MEDTTTSKEPLANGLRAKAKARARRNRQVRAEIGKREVTAKEEYALNGVIKELAAEVITAGIVTIRRTLAVPQQVL